MGFISFKNFLFVVFFALASYYILTDTVEFLLILICISSSLWLYYAYKKQIFSYRDIFKNKITNDKELSKVYFL